jgi:hypothetical protein
MLPLIGSFIIACIAAGLAVHEPVVADANVKCGLAETAEFVALALRLGQFALSTTVFGWAGSGRHRNNLALVECAWNVPLVTGV